MEDQEVTRDQNDDANQADDPMHTMSCRPTEHEISHRQSDDAEKGGYKSMFWGPETIFLDVRDEVLELVDQETRDSNEASDTDADEAEASFA